MDFKLYPYVLAPILLLFSLCLSPLMAIDIQALVDEQIKSAGLAADLVAKSNKMLEDAINAGKSYQQVKQLDKLHQESQNLRSVLSPNQDTTNKPKNLGTIFKHAIDPPIDLDKALSLTNALRKEIKNATQAGIDFSPLLSILNQLGDSLQNALDLKSQWLDTRKAN
ncbi:hypothetical protein [Helicobacter suis]|uniref:hypothetical protein n=1 Tax=Helicobacter suis TaxID=104628 RepID=UPI0013D63886|nr:hypothetical protein [Helicobacter suis]